MGDKEFRSIGETLELIREEFPEVTISKIRFLETQGLIAPERTTNGYRKFYEHDIDRLTFVLRQQREQFLPLKVIKDRITEKEPGVFVLDASKDRFAPPTGRNRFEKDIFGDPIGAANKPATTRKAMARKSPSANHKVEIRTKSTAMADTPDRQSRQNAIRRPGPEQAKGYLNAPGSSVKAPPVDSVEQLASQGILNGVKDPQGLLPNGAKRPRLFALPSSSSLAEKLEHYHHDDHMTDAEIDESEATDSDFPKNSFTARDVAMHADLTLVQVEELAAYGLLSPVSIRGQKIYCAADLELAVLAKSFSKFGLEARHLKMYRTSAEREASFLEQVILPILANKSQKSRNKAESALTQLGEIGSQFRTLLLERAIEKILKS